jgi:hypothetical protein
MKFHVFSADFSLYCGVSDKLLLQSARKTWRFSSPTTKTCLKDDREPVSSSHILTTSLSKIHVNIIHQCPFRFSKGLFFKLFLQNSARIYFSLIHGTCAARRMFHNHNGIGWLASRLLRPHKLESVGYGDYRLTTKICSNIFTKWKISFWNTKFRLHDRNKCVHWNS